MVKSISPAANCIGIRAVHFLNSLNQILNKRLQTVVLSSNKDILNASYPLRQILLITLVKTRADNILWEKICFNDIQLENLKFSEELLNNTSLSQATYGKYLVLYLDLRLRWQNLFLMKIN